MVRSPRRGRRPRSSAAHGRAATPEQLNAALVESETAADTTDPATPAVPPPVAGSAAARPEVAAVSTVGEQPVPPEQGPAAPEQEPAPDQGAPERARASRRGPSAPPVPAGSRIITVRIQRFDPEIDDAPHLETYRIPALPTDRVLNLLHYIKWYIDGSLTFRRSCAQGVCGSDAVRINGHNRLACKVLVKDLIQSGKDAITIEPIKGLPLAKDLIVDMEPFFAAYRAVKPYLITNEPQPDREWIQSPQDRARFEDTSRCILCAACTTACPVYWSADSYVGPAAIVNAHRFIFDSRDQGGAERLEILSDADGVWRCRTTFNCTEACPQGISVTKAISEVKRALMFRRF